MVTITERSSSKDRKAKRKKKNNLVDLILATITSNCLVWAVYELVSSTHQINIENNNNRKRFCRSAKYLRVCEWNFRTINKAERFEILHNRSFMGCSARQNWVLEFTEMSSELSTAMHQITITLKTQIHKILACTTTFMTWET